jgi:hypothetical protein
MRPHTTIYATSFYYACVLVLLCVLTLLYVSSYFYICALILLHMRPRTTMYVSSYYCICALILLCMCPRTTIYAPSYYYVCVLVLLYMRPHTTIVCVLILLYMRPHTNMYASSYYYICVLILLCKRPRTSVGVKPHLEPRSRFILGVCVSAFIQKKKSICVHRPCTYVYFFFTFLRTFFCRFFFICLCKQKNHAAQPTQTQPA